MWLGFTAAFIGMFYALLKFVTVFRLRQLRERTLVTRHEIDRNQQRTDKLDEKLQIEQSKLRTGLRDLEKMKKTNNRLYARLQAVLPEAMLKQLERCMDLRGEEGGVQDYKLLDELDLLEHVGHALDPLSLLVLHFPKIEESELAIALGQCTRLLEEGNISHQGPVEGEMVCYFTRPIDALMLWCQLHNDVPEKTPSLPRAVLYAGVELSAERNELRRLFARNLQKARNACAATPDAGLALNGEAYEALDTKLRQPMKKCAKPAGFYLLDAEHAQSLFADQPKEADNG
ncbi:MAG: hypothetical protein ACI906_004214 [Candidatus Latescibacterota bacterium]|jgi:hypothetical protein